jgi:hypothetical protein
MYVLRGVCVCWGELTLHVAYVHGIDQNNYICTRINELRNSRGDSKKKKGYRNQQCSMQLDQPTGEAALSELAHQLLPYTIEPSLALASPLDECHCQAGL